MKNTATYLSLLLLTLLLSTSLVAQDKVPVRIWDTSQVPNAKKHTPKATQQEHEWEPLLYGYCMAAPSDLLGLVNFYPSNTWQLNVVKNDSAFFLNAGEYYNGKLYGFVYGFDDLGAYPHSFVSINPATGVRQTLNQVESEGGTLDNGIVYDMAYSYKDDVMYAIKNTNNGPMLTTVKLRNPNAGTHREVGIITNGPTRYIALACHLNGDLFAMGVDTRLYKINLDNLQVSLVGETNIPDLNPTMNIQSMAFDHNTGTLYWISEVGDLYTVDHNSGRIRFVGQLSQYEGIGVNCLFTEYEYVEEGTPGAVQALVANVGDQGEHACSLDWIYPSETAQGEALESITLLAIYKNGVLKHSISNPTPGSQASWTDEGVGEGYHTYKLVASNSTGIGIPISISVFVGLDTPTPVTEVTLSMNNAERPYITWEAPGIGVNKGWIGSLKYDVVRFPDNVKVASDITALEFTDQVITKMENYSYQVVAKNTKKSSEPAVSNKMVFGSATIPWSDDFNDRAKAVFWTAVDANQNGECWDLYNMYGVDKSASVGFYPYLIGYDDWLISPPLALEAGKRYRLRWAECSNDYAPTPYSVYLIKNGESLDDATLLANYVSQSFNHYFRDETIPAITTTDTYYLAWRIVGTVNVPYIFMDNFVVEQLKDVDLRLSGIKSNQSISRGVPVSTKVMVKNDGANAATGFKVTLYDKSDNVLAVSSAYTGSLKTDEIAEITITWTPAEALEDINTLKATVEITGDGDLTNNSASIMMLVNPTGKIDLNISQGYFRSGDNTNAPFNLSTKTSMTQSIFYPDEITSFGYIEAVTFHSFVTVSVTEFPIRIYMATTNANNMLAWQREATLVYEGKISIPYSGVSEIQETKVVLDTPFLYEGDNLVIWTERVMDEKVYPSENVNFLRAETLGSYHPQRTACFNSNSQKFNFQNGSRVDYYSFLVLGMDVNGNVLQGKVTAGGQSAEGVTVRLKELDFETVSDAQGNYRFNFVPSGNYTISFYKTGYEEVSRSIAVSYEGIVTENAALSTVQKVTIAGKVSNSTSGLSKANVALYSDNEQFYTVTDANGNFSFSNVPGKQTYTISATHSGYVGVEKEQVVASANVNGIAIQLETSNKKAVTDLAFTINKPTWYTVALTWSTDEEGETGTLSGHRIYRNGELVNHELIQGNTFSEVVPAGDYTYAVSAVWDKYHESAQVSTASFTIEQNVCDIAITKFPVIEGFEDGALVGCWKQEYVSGMNYYWTFVDNGQVVDEIPTTAAEGRYYLRMYGNGKGSTARLVSPMMDITQLSNPVLGFLHAQYNWVGSQDIMKVFYKNSPEGEWTLLADYRESIASWKEEIINLPNPTATYWVAFEGSVDYGHGVALDYIRVLEDICQPVEKLHYVQESESSVKLAWDAPSAFDVSSYTVKRGDKVLAEYIDETSFTDTGLAIGNYTYEVITNYTKGFCKTSVTSIAVSMEGMCDPVKSMDLIPMTANSIKVTWEKPDATNIASYTISRNDKDIATVTSDKLEYLDADLSEAVYTYAVRVNYTGKSCNSSLRVYGEIIFATGAVTNLAAKTEYDNKVILTWKAKMKDIATFEVYRDGSLIESTREQIYTDRNLNPGQKYQYMIKPVYDIGLAGAESKIDVALECKEIVAPSVEFVHENGICSAVLNWDAEDAPAEGNLVWDNGPFVTYPELGFSGYDLSTPYDDGTRSGIEISRSLGFAHTDDFTLTKETHIAEIEFYAYVILGTLDPAPITGVYVAIFDGHPKNEDSALLWGSVDTNNVLKSAEFSGAFRATTETVDNIERPIFKVRAEINQTLPAGDYWIFVSMDGHRMFGTVYTIPVSILGDLETGNASFFAPDYDNIGQYKWVDFTDNGNGARYGLPFKVFGEEATGSVDIYRDGTLIASNVSGNTYTDANIATGTHTWEIVRKCKGGDSDGVELEAKCNAISITDILADNIAIYPNPAKDHVVVTGDNIQRLQIINTEGQVMGDITLDSSKNEHRVQLGNYSDGLYLFRVYTENNVATTKKVIIKK